jgi:hypothetical protein
VTEQALGNTPDDWSEPLDLRAELARIDRDRAEAHKLMRGAEKLCAERTQAIA